MIEKPSYYAIIPAVVRYDKDLPANARLMYGELTALCNKEGYCWANNKYFSSLYDVAPETVSKWISKLYERGYIKIESEKQQDGSFNRKIYIDALLRGVNENIKGGRQNIDDFIESEAKRLRGVNENVNHNTTSNNTTIFNTTKEKKVTHVSIFQNLYLAKDYNLTKNLIDQWPAVDWVGVDPDCYDDVMDFIRWRSQERKVPVRTALQAKLIIDTVRGKTAEQVRKNILRAKSSGQGWLTPKDYSEEKKQIVNDKWKETYNSI